jgi:predicted DCC family thiol-disulfide oxidoreductase YuxK
VNTEITDDLAAKAWVLFDGTCHLCTRWAQRCEPLLRCQGFRFAPLQTPWVCERLGLTPGEAPREMIVLPLQDGILHLVAQVGWTRPLAWVARLPGVLPLLRHAYRALAARRHCANGACRVPTTINPAARWLARLPLLLVAACGALLFLELPAWVLMWLLAFALGFTFKWLTVRDALAAGLRPPARRLAGYLLAWPGLDARRFLNAKAGLHPPALREWFIAVATLAAGILCLIIAAPALLRFHALAAGWIGMIGLVLALHFGLFGLASLAWRTAGVAADPIMRAPLRATSLAEFWGARWNRAFSDLAGRFLLRPATRRLGLVPATALVFLASGLLHELVISVPAGAGYGLPTAYFALQGAGLLIERTPAARALGLGRGGRGWLFTLLFTAGPAFWLFHPPFVHNVIVPMLQAIGAPGVLP